MHFFLHISLYFTVAPPQWDALKLSLMIEEANKISAKFRKHTVFGRFVYFYLVSFAFTRLFGI